MINMFISSIILLLSIVSCEQDIKWINQYDEEADIDEIAKICKHQNVECGSINYEYFGETRTIFCKCKDGYECQNNKCKDIDECTDSSLYNCPASTSCVNDEGSYYCMPECSPSSGTPCVDSTTRLMWSEKSSYWMEWLRAFDYCDSISDAVFGNWRVPNIDELRTLIKNCPSTETGGKCKVSEKNGKLSSSYWYPEGSCFCNESENSGGYYSKLGDGDEPYDGWLWSSSIISDYDMMAWHVLFESGGVYGGELGSYSLVRCVR